MLSCSECSVACCVDDWNCLFVYKIKLLYSRMPATRRVSQRQLEVLLAFTEANRDIALGRCTRGPQGHQLAQQAWESVANKLNSVADGVTKTADQWRRYWVEWKAKIKAKGADIRRNASRTGGGPNRLAPLTELEERVLKIIGRVCVEGLPGVRIPFPIPSEAVPGATNTSCMVSTVPPSQVSPIPSTSFVAPLTSFATPSTSQMEEEWLEDGDIQMDMLSSEPLLSQPSPHISRTIISSSFSRPASPQQQSLPPHLPQAAQTQTPEPSRSRHRPIRDRDVPQWAVSLEERRLAIEEVRAKALEAISVTLQQMLEVLKEIRDK